ncbi:unnamed protein product [Rhizophagus irregularis]|nr:unnamed protein product [Rhizophagus irregularis]CAB5342280.1 unnamed protein product [Rhizophagus irregularis]
MKNKKTSEDSSYKESEDNSSNSSASSKKSSAKQKNNLAEITKLEKQLKLLKKQAFKDKDLQQESEPVEHITKVKQLQVQITKETKSPSKKKTVRKKTLVRPKEESTEWSSSDPEQPIPKHKGDNYYDIPRLLHIKKRTWNGYMEAMRHICKEYLSNVAGTTMYKEIDAGLLNKVVDKFNKKNDRFPKTMGDWAQREMIRRYVNNLRESQRNPNQRKRKQKRVISPNLSRPISETEDIDIPDTTKQANIGEQDYPNALPKTNKIRRKVLSEVNTATTDPIIQSEEQHSNRVLQLKEKTINDADEIASDNNEQDSDLDTQNTGKKSTITRRSEVSDLNTQNTGKKSTITRRSEVSDLNTQNTSKKSTITRRSEVSDLNTQNTGKKSTITRRLEVSDLNTQNTSKKSAITRRSARINSKPQSTVDNNAIQPPKKKSKSNKKS